MPPTPDSRLPTPGTALLGVRILTMAQNVPGPVAVARLVAEGATAVKVEPPAGDPLASMSASWYEDLHAGVTVQRVDLKSAAGAAAMREWLTRADVFMSSHRPSSLARLGLDAVTLRETVPALRCLNIVGDTRHPEHAGHDLTYQARAGLVRARLPETLLADLVGAERAYAAAILLLREPAGSYREVGLFDALSALSAPIRHGLTVPGGLLGGGLPAYGVYDAREGRVAVAALEPHFRRRLYEALGLVEGSPLAGALRARTAKEWEQWATEHDIPLVAVPRDHTRTDT